MRECGARLQPREIIAEFQAALGHLRALLDALGRDIESYAALSSDQLALHERMAQRALQLEQASRDVRRGLAMIAVAVPDPEALGAEPVVPQLSDLADPAMKRVRARR